MKFLAPVILMSVLLGTSSILFAAPSFPVWLICNDETCNHIDLRDWEPPEFTEHAPTGLKWSIFLVDSVRSPLLQLYERWAVEWFAQLFIEHATENGAPGLMLRHSWDERTSYIEWPEE